MLWTMRMPCIAPSLRLMLQLIIAIAAIVECPLLITAQQQQEEQQQCSNDSEDPNTATCSSSNDEQHRAPPLDENEVVYSDWEVADFWQNLECRKIFSKPRPIHPEETWLLLRKAYVNVVGESHASIPIPLNNNKGEEEEKNMNNGFHVKYVVKQNEKGRGVYADQFIAKKSLIWNTRQTARFSTGDQYRQFLMSIRRDLACDVIQWAYVQELTTRDNKNGVIDSESDEQQQQQPGTPPREKSSEPSSYLRISVDLDEAILINAIEYDGDTPNMGCDPTEAKGFHGGCQQNYFALRNIQPGEELLLDYGDFAIQEGWEQFGL